MSVITRADLDAVIRRRRVRSLHRWFDVLKRSVSKPAIPGTDAKAGYLRTH